MKRSILSIIIGILILGGTYFITRDNKAQESAEIIDQTPTPTEIVVNYQENSNFSPQTYQVQEGSTVILKVTSSIADTLHFHGHHEINTELIAGQEKVVNYPTDKTGRFEFVLETEPEITLGVIEVLPK